MISANLPYAASDMLVAPEVLILSMLFQVMMAHTPLPMNMIAPIKFQTV